MTTQEYINRQRAKFNQLLEGKAIAIAAQDTHVKMVERIFESGKDAAGEVSSYNSKDPIYVNPNASPKKFPPKGKDGKTTFKNGNKHKTGYFESYKDFRGKIGRENTFMNLNLFGNLFGDFSKGVIRVDGLQYISSVSRGENEGKVKKFDKYFKLSKDERDNFIEVLKFETLNILK